MDTSKRERLIQIAAAISAKREELAALERQFDSVANNGGGAPKAAVPAAGGSSAQGDKPSSDASLPQRIMARVNSAPDRVFSAEDFDDLRGDSSIQTLRSALLRLSAKGLLIRTDRGRFKQGMKPLFHAQETAA